jgi:hypothetical protein
VIAPARSQDEPPAKSTFADIRDMGVRGILVYCCDHKFSHSIQISADQWAR